MKNSMVSFVLGIGFAILISLTIWLPVGAFVLSILTVCIGATMLIWALIKSRSRVMGYVILVVGTVALIISSII
jgi:hypothetical protein